MHERDAKQAFATLKALTPDPPQNSFLSDYIARNSGPADIEYVKAFERGCPGVRMTPDERNELRRLFHEAISTDEH